MSSLHLIKLPCCLSISSDDFCITLVSLHFNNPQQFSINYKIYTTHQNLIEPYPIYRYDLRRVVKLHAWHEFVKGLFKINYFLLMRFFGYSVGASIGVADSNSSIITCFWVSKLGRVAPELNKADSRLAVPVTTLPIMNKASITSD